MRRETSVEVGSLWGALGRVICSLLGAGILYFVWLATFIPAIRLGSSVVEIVGWLLAPVATATGFAAGIAVFERLTRANKTKFLRLFLWPMIGCAIGAGAVYWFGPMLIVFGMFAAGTASVALREVMLSIKKNET